MADDTEQSGFDLGADADAGYVVLARKYRPESFADLIGQEAMVRTLSNAFTADRIAQGYMLTGVRGVGKTTTARILARALNYHRNDVDDAEQRPTVDLSAGYGRHCVDILKSRHPDVVEMDAASNTGVDNVREIIESARYRPLNARYKVFIIDEVHMLSKGAFNALLKTLEEPPGHVKFIFATTEVRKVPVTVLSRCQRFDLRRVDVPVLVPHFAGICEKEGATADEEALALIARAAEGSVRDGLSILDQAIAMGAGSVTAASVRAMLGLADRGRIFDLLAACLSGTPKAALEAFDALHADGGDPLQLLTDLAEAVHAVSRAKTLGADGAGDGLSREERERAGELAGRLSIAILSRVWQLLVAGLDEASKAPDPRAAAEMILIRIAFTADLPTPDQIVRALGNGAAASATPANAPTSPETRGGGSSTRSPTSQAVGLAVVQAPAPKDPHGEALQDAAPSERVVASLPQHVDEPQSGHVALNSFHDVVALAGERRDAMLKLHLEDNVRLVQFGPGRIEINVLDGAPSDLAGDLGRKLTEWTGERWIVTVTRQDGAEPIGSVRRRKIAKDIEDVKSHPAVSVLLADYPDAEISEVRPIGGAGGEPFATPEDAPPIDPDGLESESDD